MGSGVEKLKKSSLILADELHKPVIKKFNKIKVYSQYINKSIFSRHTIIK